MWDRSKQRGPALLLLLAISDGADEATGTGFLSIKSLAEKTRMSGRNVQRILLDLQSSGELKVSAKKGPFFNAFSFPKFSQKDGDVLGNQMVTFSVKDGDVLGNSPDSSLACSAPAGDSLNNINIINIKAKDKKRGKEEGMQGGKPRGKVSTENYPLPAELDTPEFDKIWSEFLEYRKARRNPMTVHAQKLMLGKCLEHGPADSIPALEESIMHGWSGVFFHRHESPKNIEGGEYPMSLLDRVTPAPDARELAKRLEYAGMDLNILKPKVKGIV